MGGGCVCALTVRPSLPLRRRQPEGGPRSRHGLDYRGTEDASVVFCPNKLLRNWKPKARTRAENRCEQVRGNKQAVILTIVAGVSSVSNVSNQH